MDENTIKQRVAEHYGAIAEKESSCCGPSCCSSDVTSLISYESLEAALPEGANLGLGCGLPTTYANIQEGESVLDLGSGSGVDAFLAAKSTGPTGMVIGVDMTPSMIARARRIAEQSAYENVEFRLGEIEALPVESESVDVVLSNCVLNLVPDKRKAFAEIYRVLRDGGRFAISDVVTWGDVPQDVRENWELWVGCLAGAPDREEYLAMMKEAGLEITQVHEEADHPEEQTAAYGFLSVTLEGRKV